MNIGQLINKFDNKTNGTVKEFNKLFPTCPLSSKFDDTSIVCIGSIVGIGKVNQRFLEVNGELLEHEFTLKNTPKNKPKPSKNKIAYQIIDKRTGKVIKTLYKKKDIEKEFKLTQFQVMNMCKTGACYNDFSIKQRDMTPEEVELGKKGPTHRYYFDHKGKTVVFEGREAAMEYFNASRYSVDSWISGRHKREGVKFLRKEKI